MAAAPAAPLPESRGQQPEAAYLYEDAERRPYMLVCRYPGKRFLQYRPDGRGGWQAGLAGLEPIPYRLPELLAHLAANKAEPIYIPEGEKDVEAIRATGATATCNPMGAGKWLDSYDDYFAGARAVVVVADLDDESKRSADTGLTPGEAHALDVRQHLGSVGVAAEIFQAATGKDVSDHLAAGLELGELVPYRRAGLSEGTVFMEAYEFVDMQVDPPVPLWGSRETTIIPAGGLVVVAGRPGVGKTTWVVDLACHLAAGLPYPPTGDEHAPEAWPVPRPLRIALIENEGPLEMFRDKLGQKLERWAHPFTEAGGYLGIQVARWGAFSFAEPDTYERVGHELNELQIDLVIGDPLAMLGMEGVGSPAETRAFVQLIRGLGLGTGRAFLFLHHFRERVERNEDELQRISGAWGGHLDTLLTLQPMGREEELRMAYPKLRWGRGKQPEPVILGRVYNTQSYAALRGEGDLSALEPMLAEVLHERRAAGQGYGPGGWATGTQLAAVVAGGKRKEHAKRALEGAPHLFAMVTGTEAKLLGAKHNAKLWGLREWPEAPEGEGELAPTGPAAVPVQRPLELTPAAAEPADEPVVPPDDDFPF